MVAYKMVAYKKKDIVGQRWTGGQSDRAVALKMHIK